MEILSSDTVTERPVPPSASAARVKPHLVALLEWLVLLGLVLLVLLPASPRLQQLPSWDSGVFMYTGWRVTQGAVPYRDVWDHKPPLIYVIDAVGVLLGGSSRWGIWLVEVVFLLCAAWLLFDLVRRAFGALTGWYAVCAVLVNALLAMDGGNYTTEYALPLQMAMLWLIATAPREPFSMRRMFGLGVLSGLLFWLKQNDIGIPLALGLYLVLQFIFLPQKRATLAGLGAMLGGAAGVSFLVILPLTLGNALPEFWDTNFVFNFLYIDETWFDRFLTLRYIPVILPAMGLLLAATMGWLVGAITFALDAWGRTAIFQHWQARIALLRGTLTLEPGAALTTSQVSRLLAIALLALPIELVLVSISGNPFDHYFLALLPVFAILAAFAFRGVLVGLERVGLQARALDLFGWVLILVLVAFAAENVQGLLQRISSRQENAIVQFLRANTAPTDGVYIWGPESRVLFLAQRQAPTRFVYPTPLVRHDYANNAYVEEFMTALTTHPPRWLIDPNPGKHSLFNFPVHAENTPAEVESLLARYQERTVIDGWEIYELRANAAP